MNHGDSSGPVPGCDNLAAAGETVVNDVDGSTEYVVVLNIEAGAELGRVGTGSPVRSALFQSPGWSCDSYTFTTLSRPFVAN